MPILFSNQKLNENLVKVPYSEVQGVGPRLTVKISHSFMAQRRMHLTSIVTAQALALLQRVAPPPLVRSSKVTVTGAR